MKTERLYIGVMIISIISLFSIILRDIFIGYINLTSITDMIESVLVITIVGTILFTVSEACRRIDNRKTKKQIIMKTERIYVGAIIIVVISLLSIGIVACCELSKMG